MKNKLILYKYIFPAGLLLLGTAIQSQTNKPTTANKTAAVSSSKVYTPAAYPGGTLVNTVNTWMPQQPYALETDVTSTGRQVTEVLKNMQYMDGLGRPLQTVGWQISPSQKDLVMPVAYDSFGRQQYQFLPYASTGNDGSFRTDPFTDQKSFYTSTYPSEQPAFQGEQLFYSKTVFEASPLNRAVKSLAPGNSWAGSEAETYERAVKTEYLASNSSDSVRIWRIAYSNITYGSDNTSVNIPTTSAAYSAGTLFKTVMKDEKGNATVEYKDRDGKIILKKIQNGTVASDYSGYTHWLCTYYVYDDYGLLRFIISPKAVKALLDQSTWDITINSGLLLKELCSRYEYDERGRMIAKKIPGAAWTYMVYDIRDRLVFVQDGNLKVNNQWMTNLYDDLDRPLQTGIMTYTGSWTDLITYLSTAQSNSTSTVNGNSAASPATLYINQRVPGVTSYTATESITFDNGFTSEAGADFSAEIVAAGGNSFTSQQTVQNNPVPAGAGFTPLTLTYYDNYGWTTKTYSTANNSQLDAGDNTYADTLPAAASNRTRGAVTGVRIRTIEDPSDLTKGAWLETTNFYDDKGRLVQVNSGNYKGGTDVQTIRYDFGSKPVSNYIVHNNPMGGINNLVVKTNMNYDHAGRLLNVKKKINSEAVRTIALYQYDALGQVKNKKIGQQKDDGGSLTSTPLETQDYAFNIRGWLKGINWNNYGGSGKTAAQTNRWFAMDLSYDWGFDNNQYNGTIAGMRWQSGGDQQERSYGFGYDAVNRLLYADFNQYTSGAFNKNAGLDFTVKMGDGSTADSAYDYNGNILRMQQWGLKGTSSTQIDDLRYAYYDYSNKLQNVRDQDNDATTKLGDFRTSANHPDAANNTTSRVDYTYDVNGNLKKDLNKDIGDATVEGIIYNHLNLPWKVTVKNKGTIVYIYDATGNKLEKQIDEPASVANGNRERIVNTTYLSGFIYENSVLQSFAQAEGRIRNKRDTGNNHIEYAYDYFLKDHLGNVRMTLTDEQRTDAYPAATMELAQAATEEALYSNLATRADVPPGYPTDTSYSNPNAKVAKVGGTTGNKIGPAIVLKVMAGDKFNLQVRSWYKLNGATPGTNASPLTDLITAMSGSIGGVAGSKATGAQLSSSGIIGTGATDFLSSQSTYTSSRPKAFINWVFFDEQFNMVSSSSGFEQVGSDQEFKLHVRSGASALAATKNGYLYIYTSNEDQNVAVFFDNLQVSHIRGPLLEENHYYAFGLQMSGICSKAMGGVENKFRFNGGTELNTEFDWNMYETPYRNYDAQIGRFWQIDALADINNKVSPYVFANNNPLLLNDPAGLLSDSSHPQEQPPVTVYGDNRQNHYDDDVWGGFYWPNYTHQDARIAAQAEYSYSTRADAKLPLIQPGDSKYYIQHIPDWQRFYQAEKDGRQMQLVTVAALAAPLLASVEGVAGTVSAEASLIKTGLQLGGKQLVTALVGATAINIAQNGGDIRKLDAFDITLNMINPSEGIMGMVGVNLMNSMVDINPFSNQGSQLNTIGDGKTVGQGALDFTFGLMGEGFKYTNTTLGGSATVNMFTDVVTGNAGNKTQELAK